MLQELSWPPFTLLISPDFALRYSSFAILYIWISPRDVVYNISQIMSQTPASINLEAAPPSEGGDLTANIVNWDGPNDAANPVNWPSHMKWAHIITVAILGLIP
jgi:hypothetical protein